MGYINFDAAFRPVLSPEDLENLEDEGMEEKSDHEEITSIIVETKKFANNVTSYRVQDNIFSQTTTLQNQVIYYIVQFIYIIDLIVYKRD